MARRHLSTILVLLREIVLIVGAISLAYIAMRISEDGIIALINGVYVKAQP